MSILTAITRAPGPELGRCELTHLARQPIDFDRALAQHQGYQAALHEAGCHVVELPSDPAHPDGIFVEDVALVLDEIAVLLSPAPPSRRGERASIEAAIAPFLPLVRLPSEASIEGGDVLRVGRTLYVGQSSRTGLDGLRALEECVRRYGYDVVPVRVHGCLHLKSACCALDDETLLLNRDWVETAPFSGMRLIDVPESEPYGSNVLRLPGTVLVSAAYPATATRIRSLGYRVVPVDVSELHKAESGVTCMSLPLARSLE